MARTRGRGGGKARGNKGRGGTKAYLKTNRGIGPLLSLCYKLALYKFSDSSKVLVPELLVL